MKYNEFKDFMGTIKLLDKTYDIVRIIDPLHKRVLNLKDSELTELGLKCFDFWNNNKVCQNCVSMRAYNENTTYIKIEYNKDKIFMVTSIPHDFNNRKIVIELMKDATDSMLFGAEGNSSNSEIHALINNMNRIAVRDELTGAYNRRYINERLPVDIITSSLSDQSISVIMADIDHFKKVNDTYGHLAGDQVIREFVSVLNHCLKRNTDWVARYGGEEFLACLPGAGQERAVEIAETMRRAAEEMELLYEGKSIHITASFGVYSVQSSQEIAVDSVVGNADKMLYKAKESGRNCVKA